MIWHIAPRFYGDRRLHCNPKYPHMVTRPSAREHVFERIVPQADGFPARGSYGSSSRLYHCSIFEILPNRLESLPCHSRYQCAGVLIGLETSILANLEVGRKSFGTAPREGLHAVGIERCCSSEIYAPKRSSVLGVDSMDQYLRKITKGRGQEVSTLLHRAKTNYGKSEKKTWYEVRASRLRRIGGEGDREIL